MTTFECRTCKTALQDAEMMKHLSNTRHKTVVANFNGAAPEEVVCEACKADNIHQLQIVRFGGEDIVLLCNSCYQREYGIQERPSTAYTLSNGSILKYWDRYLKVRECACDKCGRDSQLNVSVKKDVLCNSCLASIPEQEKLTYISESTGQFLFVYLGIKEPANSKSSKPRVGRKTGRRHGSKRGSKNFNSKNTKTEVKPMSLMEKISRDLKANKYSNTLIESSSNLSLRNFKNTNAQVNRKSVERKGIKGDSKTTKKDYLKEPGNSKNNSKGNKSSPTPKTNTEGKGKSNHVKQHSGRTQQNLKHTSKNESASHSSRRNGIKGNQSDCSSHEKNHDSKTSSNDVSGISKSNQLNALAKPRTLHDGPNRSSDSRGDRVVLPESKPNDGTLLSKPAKGKSHTTKFNDNSKKYNDSTKRKAHVGSSDTKSSHDISQKKSGYRAGSIEPHSKDEKVNSSVKESDIYAMMEEGFVTNYEKYEPTMQYPDLKTYCEDFSRALFEEQKLEYSFIESFQIQWPKSSNDTAFVLKLNKKNNEELDELAPQNALFYDGNPFNERQPLFFCSKDETKVWYTFVKEMAMERNKIVLLLELFPWCKHKLPIARKGAQMVSSISSFKLLPTSAQANRILFAMTRIKNPKFVDLLLSQKPIKQIYFDNRLKFSRDSLNDSQKSAVQHVLNNSITILQGPPGTGKTSTIEEIILQMIANFHSYPILCVAASNIAIDNIAERLMRSSPQIKILRIVSKNKQPKYDRSHELAAVCLHHLVEDKLSPVMREVAHNLRTRQAPVSKTKYNALYREEMEVANSIVTHAQIILTTNVAAGGKELKALREVPVVIMDEATQSSEVSTLVPLSLPGIRTFVFVGDEKQLSSFSAVPQLEMSLFERILRNGTYARPQMLDVQYRMHPRISEFPRTRFYAGALRDGVQAEARARAGIARPLFFLDCAAGREQLARTGPRAAPGAATYSYTNRAECAAVLRVVRTLLLDRAVRPAEIAVVTPYAGQRDALSAALAADPVVNPLQATVQRDADDARWLHLDAAAAAAPAVDSINGLQVATVDSFQGHEKPVVVFSCVRSNHRAQLGFLRDRRRLNVALTRAQQALLIVGNADTLRHGDPLWRDYLDYLHARGLVSQDYAY